MFEVDRDFEVLREAWGTDPPDEVLAVFLAFDDHHRSQHGELDGLAKIGEDVAEKPPGEPELTEDLAKEQIVWSHRASPGHLTCVERHVAEI